MVLNTSAAMVLAVCWPGAELSCNACRQMSRAQNRVIRPAAENNIVEVIFYLGPDFRLNIWLEYMEAGLYPMFNASATGMVWKYSLWH
jgi:hypothetical protein